MPSFPLSTVRQRREAGRREVKVRQAHAAVRPEGSGRVKVERRHGSGTRGVTGKGVHVCQAKARMAVRTQARNHGHTRAVGGRATRAGGGGQRETPTCGHQGRWAGRAGAAVGAWHTYDADLGAWRLACLVKNDGVGGVRCLRLWYEDDAEPALPALLAPPALPRRMATLALITSRRHSTRCHDGNVCTRRLRAVQHRHTPCRHSCVLVRVGERRRLRP